MARLMRKRRRLRLARLFIAIFAFLGLTFAGTLATHWPEARAIYNLGMLRGSIVGVTLTLRPASDGTTILEDVPDRWVRSVRRLGLKADIVVKGEK